MLSIWFHHFASMSDTVVLETKHVHDGFVVARTPSKTNVYNLVSCFKA